MQVRSQEDSKGNGSLCRYWSCWVQSNQESIPGEIQKNHESIVRKSQEWRT